MSTWENASLSGVPERSAVSDDKPREATKAIVLGVAEDLVNQHGLTVGLGHLSFDEIIQKAGVSRTTAYRVWPRKERFLEDLLRRLADVASPCYGPIDDERAGALFAMLREQADQFVTVEGRRALLVEGCRITAQYSSEDLLLSPRWRTFLALIATMKSLGSEELSSELRDRMQRVDDQAVEKVARYYSQAVALLGFRPRLLDGAHLANIGAAAFEGALLLADIRPAMVAPLGMIDPFGTGRSANWTLLAISYTSTMLGVLEPDPDYDPEAALSLLV